MLQLTVPVLVFTAIVTALAVLVLGARRWLAPGGMVQLVVNGQRVLEVEAGGQLLWTLAQNAIYLPAACGGRGTCGQCRVTVRKGARPLLPTEASHIGRRDAERGIRLACMLKLRGDLEIAVDRDLLAAKRWECTVRSSRFLAPSLKELVLALPESAELEFEAGDYVLVEAPPHDVVFSEDRLDPEIRREWRRTSLIGLRSKTTEPVVRAYSLANAPSEPQIAQLVVRFAAPPPDAPEGTPPGKASSYLFSLKAGDTIAMSGPFGEFHASDGDGEMVLVAGGAGIAPIRSIILDQLGRGTERRIGFWYGARDVPDLCYREEFDALARQHPNFEWQAALSAPSKASEWHGARGLIHAVLHERYLERHPAPEKLEFYLCGPPLMSEAVVQMLENLGVPQHRIHFDDFGSL